MLCSISLLKEWLDVDKIHNTLTLRDQICTNSFKETLFQSIALMESLKISLKQFLQFSQKESLEGWQAMCKVLIEAL